MQDAAAPNRSISYIPAPCGISEEDITLRDALPFEIFCTLLCVEDALGWLANQCSSRSCGFHWEPDGFRLSFRDGSPLRTPLPGANMSILQWIDNFFHGGEPDPTRTRVPPGKLLAMSDLWLYQRNIAKTMLVRSTYQRNRHGKIIKECLEAKLPSHGKMHQVSSLSKDMQRQSSEGKKIRRLRRETAIQISPPNGAKS